MSLTNTDKNELLLYLISCLFVGNSNIWWGEVVEGEWGSENEPGHSDYILFTCVPKHGYTASFKINVKYTENDCLRTTLIIVIWLIWFKMSLFGPTESSRLTVVRANADDSGTYKCEAANIYSTSNSEVNINVEGILNFDLCV